MGFNRRAQVKGTWCLQVKDEEQTENGQKNRERYRTIYAAVNLTILQKTILENLFFLFDVFFVVF